MAHLAVPLVTLVIHSGTPNQPLPGIVCRAVDTTVLVKEFKSRLAALALGQTVKDSVPLLRSIDAVTSYASIW